MGRIRSVARRTWSEGLIAAVAALLVAALLVTMTARGNRTLLPGTELASGGGFTLSGTVGNLTPGVSAALLLTAANSYSVPITVTSVAVSVPSVPTGCPVSNLTINGTAFTGGPPTVTVNGLSQVVPAAGSATVSLPILVASTAPNGCQTATFPFNYAGSAIYTAPTVTTLVAAPNPSTFGQLVTFTATVAANVTPPSAAATPVGTVTFYQCTNPANLPSGSPASACTTKVAISPAQSVNVSGQATYSTSSLALGSYMIFAVYTPTDPSSFIASSSSTVTQVVTQAPTSTLLTSAPNPSLFGQSVTLTAQVSPSSGPTGTVSFYQCSSPACSSPFLLGTGTLNALGKATFTTSSLPAGADSLRAVYIGNTNYVGSTSPVITQTVNFTSACINGTINGGYTVHSGQSICITGRVNGGLTVQSGGALFLNGAVINGGIASTGATGLRFCASNINGDVTITASTGFVLIGDAGDDGPPGCAGNTINLVSLLTVSNSTGGFELGANQVGGSVTFSGNTGTGPTSEDTAPEVEGNKILGLLTCATSNNPSLTNGGQPNTVAGVKSGQCAAAGF